MNTTPRKNSPRAFRVRLEALATRELPDLDIATSAFGFGGSGLIVQLPFYDEHARRLRPESGKRSSPSARSGVRPLPGPRRAGRPADGYLRGGSAVASLSMSEALPFDSHRFAKHLTDSDFIEGLRSAGRGEKIHETVRANCRVAWDAPSAGISTGFTTIQERKET